MDDMDNMRNRLVGKYIRKEESEPKKKKAKFGELPKVNYCYFNRNGKTPCSRGAFGD